MGKTRKEAARGRRSNRDWWPHQVRLDILHQHSSLSNPMGGAFNYAEEFKRLDLYACEERYLRTDDHLTGLVAG